MSQAVTASPVRPVEPTQALICPICNEREVSKRRTLYDFPVCKKCWARFTNRRQAAFILDYFLFWLILWMFGEIVSYLPGFSAQLAIAVSLITLVAFSALFAFRDAISGMSPGKYLFGVQVVDFAKREPIGAAVSIKRNLALAIALLIPLISLIFILICAFQMSRGPRIGDRWAKTMVIWRKYARKPPFDPSGIYCLVCDYNLTGNVSGICPECGTPVPERTKEILAGVETPISNLEPTSGAVTPS